jgi:hypothetical protein
MGFIKGKEVEVLLNAPLQDPVKYKLMGYEVSLRHHEAEMIEVVSSLEFRTESLEFATAISSSDGTAAANSQFSILNSQLIKDFRSAICPKHPMPDPDFEPKPYYQVYQQKHGFLPNLSILDLLFNMGPESIFYL